VTAPRPLPWTELFDAIGESRFEEIRTAVRRDRLDAANRDQFLMVASAGGLLREMMPPEASADAVLAYGALLHMLFLLWDAGWPVTTLDRPILDRALADLQPLGHPPTAPGVAYVQLPERAVWAEPAPGEPQEPLDGCFVSLRAARATVLAVPATLPTGAVIGVTARNTLVMVVGGTYSTSTGFMIKFSRRSPSYISA
jgi:hypothetical protein